MFICDKMLRKISCMDSSGCRSLFFFNNWDYVRCLFVPCRVLDVVEGPSITLVHTNSSVKYFGQYNWTNFKTPQSADSFLFVRDVLAKSSHMYSGKPSQDSYGSVQLGCTVDRWGRCEDYSSAAAVQGLISSLHILIPLRYLKSVWLTQGSACF